MGFGSSGSSSVFTGPPTRSYSQAAKLCATNRCTPIAFPAARRWSVPSVRSRLVIANARSTFRMLPRSEIAVSSCTITSGSAFATADATSSASSASATAARAPSSSTTDAFDGVLVIPVTSCPRLDQLR